MTMATMMIGMVSNECFTQIHTKAEVMAGGEESDSDGDDEDQDDKAQEELPTTEVVIVIRNRKTNRDEMFRVLLDSGTNRCMGSAQAVRRAGLHIRQGRKHRYRTAAGIFTTNLHARIKAHRIMELNSRRVLVNTRVQVHEGEQ